MSGDGFDEFVRARGPALLRVAYLLTGDRHLAEDLVQSALVRTSLAWGRLEREQNADAYTRRILYNQQVSWWRRRKVDEVSCETPPDSPGRDPFAAVDLRVSLRVALQALPARQRAVVVCRYFEDLTEEATAEVLGIAIGTVKSQTHRALAALRETVPELELELTQGEA